MKICLFAYDFPPRVGGLGHFATGLGAYLAKQGEQVTVVTMTAEAVGGDHFPFRVVRRPRWRQLEEIVGGSDVLHLNGFALKPFIAAFLHRRPVVWAHYEYDTVCPIGIGWDNGRSRNFRPLTCMACMRRRGISGKITKRFAGIIVRRAVARLVAANIQPSSYIQHRQRQPRSILIPHAVDSEVFSPGLVPADPETFLFCGRLIEEKGVQVLLEALQVCRDRGHAFRLRVRGEGPYEVPLRRLAESLGLASAVTFLKFAHGSVLVNEMQRCTALVIPSVWDEVTGIVAIEAMSCKTPVVAADVGGLGEIAAKGGLIFPRGSAVALADRLIELSANPALRIRLSESARTAVLANYVWDVVGSMHRQLLFRTVAKMIPEVYPEIAST